MVQAHVVPPLVAPTTDSVTFYDYTTDYNRSTATTKTV